MQRIMSQMTEKYKTPEKQLNGVYISNLSGKEFRIQIVNMIKDFRERM